MKPFDQEYIIPFIKQLSARQDQIYLNEFSQELRKYFFPEIDFTCLDDFNNKYKFIDEPIIHQNKLLEYGISKYDLNNLSKDEDYIIKNGDLYFTPGAFKTILMCSDDDRYRKYFMLIETSIGYYMMYEKFYKENQLKRKIRNRYYRH